ncbi:MAG: DUF2589 domain-containing protein [Oscillospiraceae bacterium]|nr:DUF2589 domain-containing protein [Oscillospiraceae bacterium]
MENMFMPINTLILAPLNAIKEADIALSNGILNQIATVSDPEPQKDDDDTPIMKLKNIKFLYEKLKPDESGDRLETIGLTVPTASIIPLSALQISKSVVRFNIEVKSDFGEGGGTLKGKTASEKFRKTDRLPKMSFEIKTEATAVPEGIARLIDILDSNQIPDVESKKYVDPDGIPYPNQEPHATRNKIISDLSQINQLLDKIDTSLNSVNKMVNAPNTLAASKTNELNAVISELNEHLEKYTDMKNIKENELLLTEIDILEEKINHG